MAREGDARCVALPHLLLVCVSLHCVACYKPVVMMHGYGGSASDFSSVEQWIQQYHPGTQTMLLHLYDDLASFLPLWLQAKGVAQYLKHLNVSEDYILIGHSQGALLCRCVLELSSDHRVDTFVSLAGPQMGQYGLVGDWPNPWNLTRELIYEVFYTELLQDSFSAANYWNDPYHQQEYLEDVVFLPVYNNQSYNPNSQAFKDNFLRVNQMYYFGSPDDGVIDPWQSTQWAFWAPNEADGRIIPMRQQDVYTKDSFGLFTLDQSGRLAVTAVPGVSHTNWIDTEAIFVKYILPLLT